MLKGPVNVSGDVAGVDGRTEAPDLIETEVEQVPEPALLEPAAEPDTSEVQPLVVIQRQPRPWGWLKIGLTACCALGSIAGAALLWMLSLPPAIDCQRMTALSPDIDRLHCAREAAQSGELPKLLSSISTLEQWPSDHPLHSQAQVSIREWSTSILTQARQKMEQSDYQGAIALARQIPKSSSVYAEAQAEMARWQGDWREFERVDAAAATALKRQEWEKALQQIIALRESNFTYWRLERANALSEQLAQEKQGRKLLEQARSLSKPGHPEALSAALTLLSQIPPKTFVAADAQPNLKQWSEKLLAFGFQRWQEGYLAQAIALGKRATLNPFLAAEAENLIWLGHASQLRAASVQNWEATPSQMLKLIGAVTIASQIQPSSRFYAAAQSSVAGWKTQLQNLGQLQVAQLIANVRQPATLRLAVTQAKQIPGRSAPRIQAQTLAAYWTREAERIEDRPYLTYARRLAERGGIASLQSAIANANRVVKGRTLYGEAQGLVFAWAQQIEVLQDQPLIDRARTLAADGNLQESMRLAGQIRPGRALFLEAQAVIVDAEAQIRAAQLARSQSRSPSREVDVPPEPVLDRDSVPSFPTNNALPPRWNEPPVLPEPVLSPSPDSALPEPEQPSAAPGAPTLKHPATEPTPSAAEPIAPEPPTVTVPTEPVEPAPPAVEPTPPTSELPADTAPAQPTYAPVQEVPVSVNFLEEVGPIEPASPTVEAVSEAATIEFGSIEMLDEAPSPLLSSEALPTATATDALNAADPTFN
jgi:hypothetical protein